MAARKAVTLGSGHALAAAVVLLYNTGDTSRTEKKRHTKRATYITNIFHDLRK